MSLFAWPSRRRPKTVLRQAKTHAEQNTFPAATTDRRKIEIVPKAVDEPPPERRVHRKSAESVHLTQRRRDEEIKTAAAPPRRLPFTRCSSRRCVSRQ